jgi:hypothetical protein
MAESKSGRTLSDFNARSEFWVKFIPNDINQLAAGSGKGPSARPPRAEAYLLD